jgi:hypothetical protein
MLTQTHAILPRRRPIFGDRRRPLRATPQLAAPIVPREVIAQSSAGARAPILSVAPSRVKADQRPPARMIYDDQRDAEGLDNHASTLKSRLHKTNRSIERRLARPLTATMLACKSAGMESGKHASSTPGRRRPGTAVGKEPLQVRIPIGIKRRFKSYAALRGLDPNELFVLVWERYEASLQTHNADGGEH